MICPIQKYQILITEAGEDTDFWSRVNCISKGDIAISNLIQGHVIAAWKKTHFNLFQIYLQSLKLTHLMYKESHQININPELNYIFLTYIMLTNLFLT